MKYKILKEQSKIIKDKYGKDHIVYRIQALENFKCISSGNLGGWIESEKNLSQYGTCWIYGDAIVYEDARVVDEASVCLKAEISGNAYICENAYVSNYAKITDNVLISGHASVYDYSNVYGNAQIEGYATIQGNAEVYDDCYITGHVGISTTDDHPKVYGHARVLDKAHVFGKAKVFGYACISGESKIYGYAKISHHAQIKNKTDITNYVHISGHAIIGYGTGITEIRNHVKIYGSPKIGNADIRLAGYTFIYGNPIIDMGCKAKRKVIIGTRTQNIRISGNVKIGKEPNNYELKSYMIKISGKNIVIKDNVKIQTKGELLIKGETTIKDNVFICTKGTIEKCDISDDVIVMNAVELFNVEAKGNVVLTSNREIRNAVIQDNVKIEGEVLIGDKSSNKKNVFIIGNEGNVIIGNTDKNELDFIEIGRLSGTVKITTRDGKIEILDNVSVNSENGSISIHANSGNINIRDNVSINDNADIGGSFNNIFLFGNAIIEKFGYVGDNAWVFDDALIRGKVYGHAKVYENAKTETNSEVYDYAEVKGNVYVKEYQLVNDHMKLS